MEEGITRTLTGDGWKKEVGTEMVHIHVKCPFCGEYAIEDVAIDSPSFTVPDECWNCKAKISEITPMEYIFEKEGDDS